MIVTKTYPAGKAIDNVFNEFFKTFPSTWANENRNAAAPVNIWEDEAGFHLDFSVPGRTKEEFKINLDNKHLTISYEANAAEQKDVKSIRREFELSNFKRTFTLDEKVNVEGIEAKYENGILKVYLPKREDVKNSPKQISIQ